MAPIKFEEQLKDKLEKRTLSPSAEGWSKLSERLDADTKSSTKPLFWWLSIAAGLLIMIALSVQFFSVDDTKKVIPQVVEEEVQEQALENNKSELEIVKDVQLVNQEPTLDDDIENLEVKKETQIIDYKKLTKKDSKVEMKLVKENGENQEERGNTEAQNLLNDALMKNAVTEALNDLKTEKTSVTDREIDSLLKVANKELLKDKSQKERSKIVDANALLLSVEEDMGQSFRSKVFDALKGGYETVKTVVAERNN